LTGTKLNTLLLNLNLNYMKSKLLLAIALAAGITASAQERYLEEVFTDSEITVMKDITYGINTNVLFNTSLLSPAYVMANAAQITQEKDSLLTIMATNPANIPMSFFFPYALDTTTILKLTQVKMDVYMPSTTVDTETARPVIVYVHTGNFLPPVINGSAVGSKEDSSAVEFCTRWAKHGFVAVAPNYRHGWNPAATGAAGLVTRRATLLNAVYRAIHDMQYCIKGLRMDATAGANTYAIDPAKVAMFGQGSGGYVALAYNTLDDQAEVSLDKFVFGGNSVVQEGIVGDYLGNGGLINLYQDNGMSTDIDICVNAGGAMGDGSWLEAGDSPMITFHSPYDQFAPFDTGTVIVPTTGDDIVDVNGPNTFIPRANSFDNNAAYAGEYPGDVYTERARSFFGRSMANAPIINVNDPIVIPADGAEGLFPIVVRDGNGDIEPNGSPWEWWSLSDLQTLVAGTNAQTGGTYDANTIHSNGLLTNPNMSAEQGRVYIDTIMGYMMPRVVKTMQIGNYQSVGVGNIEASSNEVAVYPNPANSVVNFKSNNTDVAIRSIKLIDIAGRIVLENGNVNASMTELNISQLNSGVYMGIITLANDQEVITKFTVN
jgi:hypothetical protein